MKSPEIKPSQRRAGTSHMLSNWKDSRLVVAALSVAGTATLFATVIMPLSTTLLTNKIEKLTELAGDAGAIAEELEKTKTQLAVSRAEARLATMKSPLVPGSIYPIGFDSVIIGTPAQEVLTRLPGAKWDEDKSYITFDIKDGPVFSGAAYYFDEKRNVSAILYLFTDRNSGAEMVRKIMLTRFGEPYAQKKGNALWRIGDREWASISEGIKGLGFAFQIDSSPSPLRWGDALDTARKRKK